MTTAHAWTQPQGHADIAPSHRGRRLPHPRRGIVSVLLRRVREIDGRILEPAAGRELVDMLLGEGVVPRRIERLADRSDEEVLNTNPRRLGGGPRGDDCGADVAGPRRGNASFYATTRSGRKQGFGR
jgi:hypothetical protein